jgi:hypothetical protein
MQHVRSASLLVAAALAGGALAAGCGSDDNGASTSTTTAAAAAAPAATSLKGVCPDPVVVQTDWNPESDHSEVYGLAASGGDIDTNKKRYTADLVSQGKPTGVKIEIRAGGPAIGFQQVTAQMYADQKILLGYVNTDDAIEFSGKKPVTAVVAPRENWPQIFMYDPTKYDFKSVADIGKSGAKVLYFQGVAYMNYLTGKGLLDAKQVDGSYDGKPARFVTSGGKVVQQGFITAEPWQYENQVRQWGKPVKSILISSTGYDPYAEALSVRAGDVTKYGDCLKKLVPMIQQSQVDYAKDPERVNQLIAKVVASYNNGWVYPKALADYAAKVQLDRQIISNGPDDTLGNMDDARVQKMIDILEPIYAKKNVKLKAGLKPADVETNQFIDPKIGLP